jgi:glucuronate isomerase
MERKTGFIGEDFLLQNETARHLYHDYAAGMPIIDYHCHLPVERIERNNPFDNLTDIWLRGDHYKWRAMRTLGVDERYITGDATDGEKFTHWAASVPFTVRNPLYHWTHMELKNPFGVEELLSGDNAGEVYDRCNKLLATPEYTARGLLKHFNVRVVCTTDDPCDDLRYHTQLAASGFGVKVLPAFRPDNVLRLGGGETFLQYIARLSEASGVKITDIDSLLEALKNRVAYFDQKGGCLADHGLNYIPSYQEKDTAKIGRAFKAALAGETPDAATVDQYSAFVLAQLCRMYHEKDWVQQFHLGALRNVNTGKLKAFGADTGFDSIADFRQAEGMAWLFDNLERTGQLTRTIIYNLNPADNEIFATMGGNFNEGPSRGKMQFGSAWWFLDQLDGMEKQINALSNMGILSCFVGMLTDSRCFLSYSRHEYFRRLLCNMFGKDVQAGLLPDDEKWLGSVIQDICYHNAESYFNW